MIEEKRTDNETQKVPDYALSYMEFVKLAKKFTALSDELADGWVFCDEGDHKPYSYLKKTTFLESEEGMLKAEYIVSYSISYAVPVISFNIWRANGALLTLKDVEKISKLSMRSQKDFYSVITQQEHHTLHRPYFTLHPCHTGSLLSGVAACSVNVLLTFLSAVAPVVGLPLSLDYAVASKREI